MNGDVYQSRRSAKPANAPSSAPPRLGAPAPRAVNDGQPARQFGHRLDAIGTGIVQRNGLLSSVSSMLPTRWYEWNGKEYIPRTIGLPSITGWAEKKDENGKPEEREGKPVWMGPEAFFVKVEEIRLVAEDVRGIATERTGQIVDIVTDLGEQIGINRENYQEIPDRIRTRVVDTEEALDAYLRQKSTAFVIFGLTGVVATIYAFGLWLATLQLPWWAAAAATSITTIYSVYLTLRWTRNSLIPAFARLALLALNLAMTGAAIGTTLFSVFQEEAFRTLIVAGVPFALLLEHAIQVLIEKVRQLREHYRERAAETAV
jgi:putative flippase GtrA